MIILYFYLGSIILTWLLYKLSIIIDKDNAPIEFGFTILMFVPIFNLGAGLLFLGLTIKDFVEYNDDFKNNIVKFFKLDK